jgi:hypothetical protein
MASSTLICKDVRPARHVAFARRQALSVVATSIDIPSGNLGWRRRRAIAKWLSFGCRDGQQRHNE